MPKSSELKCYFKCDIDGPLHRFPKWEYPHTEKFNQWKSVLDSTTQEKGNNYIYNSIRICHKHFEEYLKSSSRRLTSNAVPTLNLNLPQNTTMQHIIESQDSIKQLAKIDPCTSSFSQQFDAKFNTDNMSSGIHNDLTPISWLSGSWVTEDGHGQYPNLGEFKYHEELDFTCIGQPMFNFMSKSTHPEKGTPMHQERGFLRIQTGTNNLAFVVSHNFGLTSLEEGQFDEKKKEIKLFTVNLSRMSFAKPPEVKSFKREIKLLDPNTLEIILYMETENTPMCEHLKAVYKRKC